MCKNHEFVFIFCIRAYCCLDTQIKERRRKKTINLVRYVSASGLKLFLSDGYRPASLEPRDTMCVCSVVRFHTRRRRRRCYSDLPVRPLFSACTFLCETISGSLWAVDNERLQVFVNFNEQLERLRGIRYCSSTYGFRFTLIYIYIRSYGALYAGNVASSRLTVERKRVFAGIRWKR